MSKRQIVDKYGRQYLLTIGIVVDLVRMSISDRNAPAGYANLALRLTEELDLGDIRIRPPYQQRGLGTALLKEVLRFAQEQKISIIRGFVVQRDLDMNPRLLEWYQHNGFTVVTATDEERMRPFHQDAVALLSLRLK